MMDLQQAVLEHAGRGVRLQLLLRGALVVFLVLTVALLPPVHHTPAFAVIVAAYGLAAAAFGRWAWRGSAAVARWGWLGLFVDLAVLAVLALVSDAEAAHSWTPYVLVVGCFLLPVLAATQLRPGVCVAVGLPTVAVFLVDAIVTRSADDEPWASIFLQAFLLATVVVAAVGLSGIQRARVGAIGGLLEDRTRLLEELVQLEERERAGLAERLHDGALQYVLAARLDVDDLPDAGGPDTVERIDHALAEATRMLRSTVAELHPAVLDQAGLARAVQDLATATARPGLAIDVDVAGWPDAARTPADGLLIGAARELLGNVVKHAGARRAAVTLGLVDGRARLVVRDDGRGLVDSAPGPAAGHIGLHSQRLRVEAAGGSLTVEATGTGTTATVVVPVST
jgi:two-component system, NarL family, sensor kinase